MAVPQDFFRNLYGRAVSSVPIIPNGLCGVRNPSAIRVPLACLLLLLFAHPLFAQQNRDWPVYGGSASSTHYSPLAQINRDNVKSLQIAWTFDSDEIGGLQTSPIIVDGVLYGITPTEKTFALEAATGKLLWKFDSGIIGTQPDRGLAYWKDGEDRRILVGVMNSVYALDAQTGRPIPTFGKDGRARRRSSSPRRGGRR